MKIKEQINAIKIINFDVIHNAECGQYVYHYINNFFIDDKSSFYLDKYEGSVYKYNNNLYFVSMIFDQITLAKRLEELLDLDATDTVLSSSCINCALMRACSKGRTITDNVNDTVISNITDTIDELSSSFDEETAAKTANELRTLRLKLKYVETLIALFKSIVLKHNAKGGFGVTIKKRTELLFKKSAALILAQHLALNEKFVDLLSLKMTLFKKSSDIDDKTKSSILNDHCEKITKEYSEFK